MKMICLGFFGGLTDKLRGLYKNANRIRPDVLNYAQSYIFGHQFGLFTVFVIALIFSITLTVLNAALYK